MIATEVSLLIYIAYFANIKGYVFYAIIYAIIWFVSFEQGFANMINTYCEECDIKYLYDVPLFGFTLFMYILTISFTLMMGINNHKNISNLVS